VGVLKKNIPNKLALMGQRPTQGDEKSLRPATTLYRTVALSFVIPSEPRFPTSPLSPATTHVVLRKENHTQLTEAATLVRKSGEAEGSAVPPTFRGHFFDRAQRSGEISVWMPLLGNVFRRSVCLARLPNVRL
jgi:hypothetical protein